MNSFNDRHPFLAFWGFMGVCGLAIVAFTLVLLWCGVIHDLDCPEGSRQMFYMIGKTSRTVCAVAVPER